VDILAWHPERWSLLVVELKTELAEVQLLMSKMDQRTRLAARIARERGWEARHVACWSSSPTAAPIAAGSPITERSCGRNLPRTGGLFGDGLGIRSGRSRR